MEQQPTVAAHPTLEEEVFVSLVRTVEALTRRGEVLLKRHGLTAAQYNVLRILRGAGGEGLACGEIGERLLTRDPDITRLLDRIETRGLIARAREEVDRRVVKTRITPDGLRLLAELDAPVREIHRRQLRGLPATALKELLRLLQRARSAAEAEPAQE